MSTRTLVPATCLALGLPVILAFAVHAQSPEDQYRARATAFFEALAGDSAEAFEAMARDNYTAAALARDTPEQRKARFGRTRTDFGRMTLAKLDVRAGGAVLTIEGATGVVADVDMDMERTPPYRILGYLMKVEGPSALPPLPINGSMSGEDLGKALDAYLAPLVRADGFAGVVLLARNGTTVLEKGYGAARREGNKANTPATRFNLGSINKIFTTIAVAQLVTQGKLALTDSLARLLPDYPNKEALGATVTQLLDHRAGIADFFGPDFDAAPKSRFRSNADYYRFVADKPLRFAPGTKYEYCNGCYIVLGAIIERVAGVPYEQYIDSHVFKPVGMKTAGFSSSDRFPSQAADGYTLRAPESRNVLQPNDKLLGSSGSAAGGGYATAADLLAFDNALRERRLLNAKMTAWVLKAHADSITGARAAGDLSIAGGAPGLNAMLRSDGTWTVIVLANLDPPAAQQVAEAIDRQLHR